MAITTTGLLPSPVQQSFSYKLLSVPVPNMIHKIPAMKKNMPRNGGNTMRFRRYQPLDTALVPLGIDGINPPAQVLNAVDRLCVHIKSLVIDLELPMGQQGASVIAA